MHKKLDELRKTVAGTEKKVAFGVVVARLLEAPPPEIALHAQRSAGPGLCPDTPKIVPTRASAAADHRTPGHIQEQKDVDERPGKRQSSTFPPPSEVFEHRKRDPVRVLSKFGMVSAVQLAALVCGLLCPECHSLVEFVHLSEGFTYNGKLQCCALQVTLQATCRWKQVVFLGGEPVQTGLNSNHESHQSIPADDHVAAACALSFMDSGTRGLFFRCLGIFGAACSRINEVRAAIWQAVPPIFVKHMDAVRRFYLLASAAAGAACGDDAAMSLLFDGTFDSA